MSQYWGIREVDMKWFNSWWGYFITISCTLILLLVKTQYQLHQLNPYYGDKVVLGAMWIPQLAILKKSLNLSKFPVLKGNSWYHNMSWQKLSLWNHTIEHFSPELSANHADIWPYRIFFWSKKFFDVNIVQIRLC
jgi:hypothetical protein